MYKPGRTHRNGDALSRPPIVQRKAEGQEFDFDPATWAAHVHEGTKDLGTKIAFVETIEAIEDAPMCELHRVASFGDVFRFSNVLDAQMREEQLRDTLCTAMILFKERQVEPVNGFPLTTAVRNSEPYYVIRDGVLYHVVKERGQAPQEGLARNEQLVMPKQLQQELIAERYACEFGAHLGYENIFGTIRQACKGCLLCARFNEGDRRIAKLHAIQSTAPWQRVLMEYEGQNPETGSGNKYILVFQGPI